MSLKGNNIEISNGLKVRSKSLTKNVCAGLCKHSVVTEYEYGDENASVENEFNNFSPQGVFFNHIRSNYP